MITWVVPVVVLSFCGPYDWPVVSAVLSFLGLAVAWLLVIVED